MNSVIIDTNCIVRYITNDLPDQADRIEAKFQDAQRGLLAIELEEVVVLEVLFYLTKWQKLTKVEASELLVRLISVIWLHIETKKELVEALTLFAEKNMDFVDLLLWTKAKSQGKQVLSFDNDFDKLEPNLRLAP
jgi:uncharacterized protein